MKKPTQTQTKTHTYELPRDARMARLLGGCYGTCDSIRDYPFVRERLAVASQALGVLSRTVEAEKNLTNDYQSFARLFTDAYITNHEAATASYDADGSVYETDKKLFDELGMEEALRLRWQSMFVLFKAYDLKEKSRMNK